MPDYYLVTDRYSSMITKKIAQKKTIELGFINYNKRITFKQNAKKKKYKNILFCGQPLHHLSSYIKTLKELFQTLKILDKNFQITYRPHPKEEITNVNKILNLAIKNSINLKLSIRKNINYDLIRSEIILTCYSSSIMDFSFLNFSSKKAIGSSICLMYEPGIQQYYKNYTKLDFLPYEKMNLTKVIYKKKLLKKELESLFYEKYKNSQWLASKKIFSKTKKNLDNFDLFIKKNFYK